MNINHKLAETDIKNVDVISQLDHQIRIRELKKLGWIFDKTISMKIRFYKTGELDGSRYVNILWRSNALINNRNDDKKCFV